MMIDYANLPDALVLALLVYGEARGEPVEGQIGVANVVRNRRNAAVKPLPSYATVCLMPEQFSCFNADSPEAAEMQRAARMVTTQPPSPTLGQCIWIADGIISGALLDNTRGATHYLTTGLYESEQAPEWALQARYVSTLGHQTFLVA